MWAKITEWIDVCKNLIKKVPEEFKTYEQKKFTMFDYKKTEGVLRKEIYKVDIYNLDRLDSDKLSTTCFPVDTDLLMRYYKAKTED